MANDPVPPPMEDLIPVTVLCLSKERVGDSVVVYFDHKGKRIHFRFDPACAEPYEAGKEYELYMEKRRVQ